MSKLTLGPRLTRALNGEPLDANTPAPTPADVDKLRLMVQHALAALTPQDMEFAGRIKATTTHKRHYTIKPKFAFDWMPIWFELTVTNTQSWELEIVGPDPNPDA
ncbi:MAG: hypothetical protein P8H53_07265 [Paracoccaceae bacterium]|jgi:hypothetical protein|nr:hypothetical protein [Paracoccaceae bacterium]